MAAAQQVGSVEMQRIRIATLEPSLSLRTVM